MKQRRQGGPGSPVRSQSQSRHEQGWLAEDSQRNRECSSVCVCLRSLPGERNRNAISHGCSGSHPCFVRCSELPAFGELERKDTSTSPAAALQAVEHPRAYFPTAPEDSFTCSQLLNSTSAKPALDTGPVASTPTRPRGATVPVPLFKPSVLTKASYVS